MATFPQTITYRDDKGQTATMKMYVVNATAAGALTAATAIVNAMDDLTNAANNGARGAYTSPPSANSYGTDAQYESIEDKAVLTFRTATGSPHRYQVPAPIAALFRVDGETVKSPDAGGDAQEILMDILVDAMVGVVSSRDGNLLAAYIGGTRRRTKNQRKFNIYTLNPDLSGPGL